MPFVYDELRRQTKILMSNERDNHTLQPTAFVHEAFIKLSKQSGIKWKNRSHCFGIASRLMRQILVHYARLNAAEKRGSKTITFSIGGVDVSLEERANLIINLDEILDRFAELDEEQSKIIELKFFGGLTNKEVAEALDISERIVVNS